MQSPSPNWNTARIVEHLRALGTEENRAGMARFGINTERALGVGNAVLRPMARALGRNHERAQALWDTGWREARLLAAFTEEPALVTAEQARRWAADIDSWEIVDSVSDLFARTPFWRGLIAEFAADEREFVRRTAFAMIASAAVHCKREPDSTFRQFLPLIARHATDQRNFVKKAVNWALRQIGKRSTSLHAPAVDTARRLAASPDSTARWIGRDAAKELSAEKTLERLKGRKSGSVKA